MEAILNQIKDLVVRGRVQYTEKARQEMDSDNLTPYDVEGAILNAESLRSKRSRSRARKNERERVYIIVGASFSGLQIYTKGVIRKEDDTENFYVLISSKRSTDNWEGGKK